MKERHCKTCGQTGHYAKTCGRRATAATAPVDRDVKPENAMHEAAPTTAATREERRAERERRRDAERAVAKQHGDEARRRREESEAKALPTSGTAPRLVEDPSPEDLAGIERQRARIAATRPGEFVPKNAAFLAVLRAGIAALDAQHATPSTGAST